MTVRGLIMNKANYEYQSEFARKYISIGKAEGQAQIDAFLQRQPGAALAAEPPSPGHLLPLPDNRPGDPNPVADAVGDGFFLALIEKT